MWYIVYCTVAMCVVKNIWAIYIKYKILKVVLKKINHTTLTLCTQLSISCMAGVVGEEYLILKVVLIQQYLF